MTPAAHALALPCAAAVGAGTHVPLPPATSSHGSLKRWEGAGRRALLIDNFDSFTWNLAHQLAMAGAAVRVVRNDAVDLAAIDALAPTHVVLSPGPGHPGRARDFGICRAVLAERVGAWPILGVCLGHQGIVTSLGGHVGRHHEVVHGKPSPVFHDGQGLFAGLPQPLQAMRYHSLVARRSDLPAALRVTAWLQDGTIMAIERPGAAVWGVQFHPESVGTPDGHGIILNFLAMPSATAATSPSHRGGLSAD